MVRVAIDFDETLYPMLTQLDKFHKQKRPNIPIKHTNKYHYATRYSLSEFDSKVFVRQFYNSEFHHATSPLENCVSVLRKLKRKRNFELGIITGRQYYGTTATENYVKSHMYGLFDYIEYTNSYSLYGGERSKCALCKKHNVDIIIDDSLDVCESMNANDTFPLLFGYYPWNSSNDTFARLKCWDELDI